MRAYYAASTLSEIGRTVPQSIAQAPSTEQRYPQRQDLPPDLAAALDASPAAAAFWDELAQFYRRAYLRWIDATKRSPALRAERIATVVALLERGVKERP
jgi:uncharacterized protein YdeI (YjbR/CyaY-like superfamily)